MADYPNFAGEAQFKDTASVPTPPANNLAVYSDGGVLKTKNSSGTVTTLSGNVALPIDEFIPSTAKVQSGRFNTYILGQPSTKSQTNGFITWGLAYVPETKNYTTAYIWVTNSAASSEVKLGFYQISSGGEPTTKIVETAGIATTSTGLKTVSFTSTQFSKGYVMVAVASNGSAVLLAALNGSSWGFFRGFNGVTWPDYSTHTYANALPDPWSGTIVDASVGNPMIGLT